MNTIKTKKAIEVMQAYCEGQEIEFHIASEPDQWDTIKEPTWNWQKCKYRIKPNLPEWNWSTTPWLNYLAMDRDGRWYLHQNEPICDTSLGGWLTSDSAWVLVPSTHAPKWTGDWTKSLISRPGI